MTELGDRLRALAVARSGRSREEDAVAVLLESLAAKVDLAISEADQVVPSTYSRAMVDVCDERLRQQTEEGWTAAHDDKHPNGELARAAACYALGEPQVHGHRAGAHVKLWPWSRNWWKPKDRRRNLVRAAALIIAEIERLDRAATKAD